MKEAILHSVPKFGDDGKILFREHEFALSKFLTCRREYIQTESLKKTIVPKSLIGRAVLKIKDCLVDLGNPGTGRSIRTKPNQTIDRSGFERLCVVAPQIRDRYGPKQKSARCPGARFYFHIFSSQCSLFYHFST